ncbi:uncharacterized protein LOC128222578 [Mya arenaria]|uniref:uncharacterized protein LOC128222578 n=1 Tax=Mya arenaria TaxID=6604 RepID=UPI0022E5D362|nr:uncharacterized protein LOC128222578 [Mya arenaria]
MSVNKRKMKEIVYYGPTDINLLKHHDGFSAEVEQRLKTIALGAMDMVVIPITTVADSCRRHPKVYTTVAVAGLTFIVIKYELIPKFIDYFRGRRDPPPAGNN